MIIDIFFLFFFNDVIYSYLEVEICYRDFGLGNCKLIDWIDFF